MRFNKLISMTIVFFCFAFIYLTLLLGCYRSTKEPKYNNAGVGKTLAENYCVSCHPISNLDSFEGLRNIRNRRDIGWIYKFVENPLKMIETDSIAKDLYEKWKPTVMTGFPQLETNLIDSILDYYDSVP